jgi:hypothetical protein
MLFEPVELFESSLVEQKLYALAGGHLPARVLALDASRAAAFERGGILCRELCQAAGRFGFGPGRVFDSSFRCSHLFSLAARFRAYFRKQSLPK